KRLAYNSPSSYLPDVVRRLRREGTYVWFYSSPGDRYLDQNKAFSRELGKLHIPHRFLVVSGGHTWRAWRENFPDAILAASLGLVGSAGSSRPVCPRSWSSSPCRAGSMRCAPRP